MVDRCPEDDDARRPVIPAEALGAEGVAVPAVHVEQVEVPPQQFPAVT